MNIRHQLTTNRSKETWKIVQKYIGTSQEKFDELLDIFLGDDHKLNVSAGQCVSYCADKYPFLVVPHYERLLTNLERPKLHNSVKRNTIRILQNVDLPEDLLGLAAELCFSFLNDPNEAIATRVFSMSVCYNICVKEPELVPELIEILEYHLPHGSTGFKNRGNKILKKLRQIKA